MADYDPDRLMDERPGGTPSMTVRPRKLTRDAAETLVRKYNPDITRAAVQGEVDNIMRESGGNAGNDTGDGGTSGGLYQHHKERLSGLKSFAAKEKADWRDPDIQVRYSRMEKERDYPGLLKLQQTVDDRSRNEDAFKRIFERPASVLWGNNAQGQPVLGNDRFQFSDYAMREHSGRPDTGISYMSPGDYLDLSPELSGKPFSNPSGRALMKSFNQGDKIEAIPTLDMKVDGNTGTVTDQDGRHRALLAQQEGIEAIPVAIRQQGTGTPTEIQGMSGKLLPNDFVPAAQMRQAVDRQPAPAKEPISLMGRIGEAIIPSAHAAEPTWADAGMPAAPTQAPAGGPTWADAGLPGGGTAAPSAPADNMAVSAIKGAAKGFGDTVYAGQELIGKGVTAVSDAVMPPEHTMSGLITGAAPQRGMIGRTGEALTADARERVEAEKQAIAADKAAHPWATGIGEAVGGMLVPGGIGAKLGGGAIRQGVQQGALAGLLTPEGSDGSFWRDKILEAATGGAAGAVLGKAANFISHAATPAFRATVGMLMREGVELTPGQLAGGKVRRVEDAMMSMPGIGSQIREAQRRSIQTFNRAAINRSLDDIGTSLPPGVTSGHEAIAAAQDAFTSAYRRVIPNMQGTVDPPFRSALGDILTKAQRENLPDRYRDELRHLFTQEIAEPFMQAGGQLPGDAVQKIGSQLDNARNSLGRSEDTYRRQMARYIREADTALDDMMGRQNPALQAAKDRIDAGYAKFKTVQRAATSVGTHPDGTFTPAQLNRAVQARDKSKDKAAFARGDALMQDLAIAARDVLPQKVPDSGTPERAAVLALLSGKISAIPGMAAGLVGGGLYTAPASRAFNAAMNRLSQPPGPARNLLSNMAQTGAQALPPMAGLGMGAIVQPNPGPP